MEQHVSPTSFRIRIQALMVCHIFAHIKKLVTKQKYPPRLDTQRQNNTNHGKHTNIKTEGTFAVHYYNNIFYMQLQYIRTTSYNTNNTNL